LEKDHIMSHYRCKVCGVTRSETPFCHGPMADENEDVIRNLRQKLEQAAECNAGICRTLADSGAKRTDLKTQLAEARAALARSDDWLTTIEELESQLAEARALLRYAVSNTRINNTRDGRQYFLLSVTEGWYDKAAEAGGE